MDQATQTMIDNLQKNTGKSLAEWKQIVTDRGIEKHNEIIKFLKDEHGFANLVALKVRSRDAASAESPELLVQKQYQGKEGLLPLYEKLVAELNQLGDDVELAPKNAYVSVRRKKQFALLQPSTKTRLDVGINLPGMAPAGKLEKSGSFNAMCSHRVRLESMADIDPALLSWLKAAYEQAK